jgi:hypothetical protein
MVIETYLHLRDPEGDRLFWISCECRQGGASYAIHFAEKSVHPDIVTALLQILQQKVRLRITVEKKAEIRSLAAIGDPVRPRCAGQDSEQGLFSALRSTCR